MRSVERKKVTKSGYSSQMGGIYIIRKTFVIFDLNILISKYYSFETALFSLSNSNSFLATFCLTFKCFLLLIKDFW